MSSLFDACIRGDSVLINQLIASNKNKTKPLDFNSGLFGACAGGHMSIAKFMILNGANALNTAFDYACTYGHISTAQLMILRGANDWHTGFGNACGNGHIKLVEILVSMLSTNPTDDDKKVVEADDDKMTDCNAADDNDSENDDDKETNDKVKDLLNHGLANASFGGHIDIVKFLISKGADDWHLGFTNARYANNVNVMHLMILKGADISDVYKVYNPKDWKQICQLLSRGLAVEYFSRVSYYQDLKLYVLRIRQSILKSNVMISGLLGIVSQFIVV